MKKESLNTINNELTKSMLKGGITGLCAMAVILCIFALIITVLDLSATLIFPFSMTTLVIGSLIFGLIAGKCNGEKGIYIGVFSGFIYFTVFTLISLFSSSTNWLQVLIRLLCTIIPSVFGSVLGVNSGTKTKFKI